ncbi:MAG: hypothetical protein J0L88_09130 [Xanthomonadales bacterium]|nr:hypothetical protein [Xanthomonadales bacterium]
MHADPSWPPSTRLVRIALAVVLATSAVPTLAETIFRSGFEPLAAAPVVAIQRDDRVATLELDYDAENPWGQWWTMDGGGRDDAGFLVTWWPLTEATSAQATLITRSAHGSIGCLAGEHASADLPAATARWLVTGNRRVQLQPLANGTPYRVRVERVNSLGEITSLARVLDFDGGDGARVAALRNTLTWFDDFNLPMGPADETLWNNAVNTSTDPRFNLFFINDQYHAHTLHGTRVENVGDRSQTSQRFRKPLRIVEGERRRIVFDMDSPLSPRSVWYLDLNPVRTDVTGHADFFDEEGALGLPAGMLRLRAQFQGFSVSLIGMDGASHRIASVDLEQVGRQQVTNVRRHFEARVGTDGIEILVDGRSVIDAAFAPYALRAGDYEPMWIGFGYNTAKDGVPYYLLHWDNFGFDGPSVDPRTVHNYVTRIAGTDYQKTNRGSAAYPTFTVDVPDDLHPTTAGATAEAWLVLTYQMGDYSSFALAPGDHVRINDGASVPLPARPNNSEPNVPGLLAWHVPSTVRVKLGDITHAGVSPLVVGENRFRFHAENAGILNVHIEVAYPPGSAPAYTPPAAIHPFPLHADLPRLGPPARFASIGGTGIGEQHLIGDDPPERIDVAGQVALDMVVGNRSYADWAPQLMVVPVASTEVWSTGGTTGVERVEVYLRRVGSGSGPGTGILRIDTARDAPAPLGRYLRSFDSTAFANGDYEIFVQATTPSGLKSHPSYGNETYLWDAAELAGAYYPIQIRIAN